MSERTCVVSRRKADPADLVRLVLSPEGVLYVDYRGRLPGRGAWVLPEKATLEKLQATPKILNRALKTTADTTGVLEKVQEANLLSLLDALSLSARSGALASGHDAALACLSSSTPCAVGLASDASPRVERRFFDAAGAVPIFRMPLDREQIGDRIGKGPRAVFAVASCAASKPLLRELRRMAALR